jgi:type IV pilus assembly protein PilP
VNASLPPAVVRKPANMPESAEAQMAQLLNVTTPPPYNPTGKIDPFEPLVRDESPQAPTTTIKPVRRERNSPLEKIDLGQLKLVAIITSGGGNRALVEETSGKGYILKEGTFVGLNSGKVVGISLDKVMIEEEYEDAYGKSIIKKKEITLPKPPGE